MSALVFILPAYILLYHAFSLYEPMRMQGRRLVLSNIVKANSLGILITTFILYTIEEGDISRSVLYMFYGICIVASWGSKNVHFLQPAQNAKERTEPETGSAGWVQPGSRRVY